MHDVQVASEEGLCKLNQQSLTLAEILRSHLQQPHVSIVQHGQLAGCRTSIVVSSRLVSHTAPHMLRNRDAGAVL